MRLFLAAALSSLLAGCTFGVKTCSPTDPCSGGGQCVQGVCTIAPPEGGGTGGGAEEFDAGTDAGLGGGAGGGGGSGGGIGGGAGGGTGGGGGVMPFDAGPLEGLVFLTPPRVTRAGECSDEIQVGVFVDGGTGPLFLGFSQEDTLFFEDANCALSPVTEISLSAANVASIHFKSPTVGSVLVNVSLAMEDAPVGQVQHVIAGRPGQLSFGTPVSVRAGQCSSPLVIQVRDDFGNMSAVSQPLLVELTSNSSTTQFFAPGDATCSTPLVPASVSLPSGSNSGAFRFKDSTPGMPVFGATQLDGGLEEMVSPASQEQEIF